MTELIQAIKKAQEERTEVENIMARTNDLCYVSSAYRQFDRALYEAREENHSLTDEYILNVLNAVKNKATYEKVEGKMVDVVRRATSLLYEANRVGVTVDFQVLLQIDGDDVDTIEYWSTSSLYC